MEHVLSHIHTGYAQGKMVPHQGGLDSGSYTVLIGGQGGGGLLEESERFREEDWVLQRTGGNVTVTVHLGMGLTPCLSCDKSQPFWLAKLLGWGLRTLRSFWRICLQADEGSSEKASLCTCHLSGAFCPNNQYVTALHFGWHILDYCYTLG